MAGLHPLQVSGVDRLTEEAVALTFDIPSSLDDDFRFCAGQYLTLSAHIDGVEVRRSYSICSAPHEGSLRVGIKALPNGVFSNYANTQIHKGDTLKVGAPEGRFVFTPSSSPKKIMLFAAGSGITPMLSIAKTALNESVDHRVVLVYGNRNPENSMFADEIHTLTQNYADRFSLIQIFSRARAEGALFGRIDNANILYVLNTLCSQTDFDDFYICGPGGMIETCTQVLKDSGVGSEKIHVEHFGGSVKDISSEQKGIVSYTVVLDDEVHRFTADAQKSVLDAALAAGIEAPYSCQGGVCGSCIGRVKSGSVEMGNNQILTDGEVEEGLVLSCQASCTSDSLEIDFDDV